MLVGGRCLIGGSYSATNHAVVIYDSHANKHTRFGYLSQPFPLAQKGHK